MSDADPAPTGPPPSRHEPVGADAAPGPAADDRPVHLRLPAIGLVALGGAVGTAARAAVAASLPAGASSWPILVVNVLGAFCLGLLLESLAHRGADVGRRRGARLLLGTGLLGGFTTYSTLAVDVATLLGAGSGTHTASPTTGVGYGLLTVVAGLVAVVLGIALAGTVRPAGRR